MPRQIQTHLLIFQSERELPVLMPLTPWTDAMIEEASRLRDWFQEEWEKRQMEVLLEE